MLSPFLFSGALSLLLAAFLRENADRDGFALLDSVATVAAAVELALPLLILLLLLLLWPERGAAALPGRLERDDDLVPEVELREVLPLFLLFLLLLLLLLPGLRLSVLARLADLSLRSAANQIDVLPLPGHRLAAFAFALLPGLLLLLLLLALLLLLSLAPLAALAFADRPPDDQKVIGLGDDRLPGRRINQSFADDRHAGEGSANLLLLLVLLLLLRLLSAGLIRALLSAVLFLCGKIRYEQERDEHSGQRESPHCISPSAG